MDITTEDLKRLHEMATEARNEAHKAYIIALKNPTDTSPAFRTLTETNRVRDTIYEMVLKSITAS